MPSKEETVNVRKSDLVLLLDAFDCFAQVSGFGPDECKFCWARFSGDTLTHEVDCPCLVAQDIETGL